MLVKVATRLSRDAQRSPNEWWLLLLVLLGPLSALLLTYRAPVVYTRSDPHLSLFAAQALVQEGTLRLDDYRQWIDGELDDYAVRQHNGHLYYYFPPGPSLFSAPAVWLANQTGKDMTVTAHNQALQKVLASLSTGLVFFLVYRLGRTRLESGPALLIAVVTVCGSALISTLGTALWNINFAVLFTLLSLWLLMTASGPWVGPLLGLLLFGAFLSRPTSLTFIGPALLLLLWRRRRTFASTVVVLGVLLFGFALLSWLTYGQPLPPYYATSRLDRSYEVGRTLYGHLLSPSRGLLVFSPFIIVVLLGMLRHVRALSRQPLFWLALSWLCLHLGLVSHIGHWWGGHTFGPRLLTDLLPAVVVLTILLWEQGGLGGRSTDGRLALGAYLLLGLAAVLINSGQGLYNPSTQLWNDYPNVDVFPEYLYDWRYPQFLASPERLERRYREHQQRPETSGAAPPEPQEQFVQFLRLGHLGQPLPEVKMIGQPIDRAPPVTGRRTSLDPGQGQGGLTRQAAALSRQRQHGRQQSAHGPRIALPAGL